MKTAVFVIFALLLATTIAEDSITITQTNQTVIDVNTLTYTLPAFSVTCNGMCNGKITATFIVSESLTELNKSEHSCIITAEQKTCTVIPTFKVFRWSNWDPTILIKVVSEAKVEQPAIEARGTKITLNRLPGTLVGTIKKLSDTQAEVTFDCNDALCMGTKLSVTGSSETFDCGDLDINSLPCKTTLKIPTGISKIYGVATTVIPKNGSFETKNFIEVKITESPQVNEPTIPDNQQLQNVVGPNVNQPVNDEKNIFQQIWEWFLGLFGIH